MKMMYHRRSSPTPTPTTNDAKNKKMIIQLQLTTSPQAEEANTSLSLTLPMPGAKKRRTSYNCSLSPSTQSHQYQQKSSSVQGLNKECFSAFASMPNIYKEEAEASSTNKEIGKKSSQDHPQEQEGGDTNAINDTIMLMRNPYLPHHDHVQVFSPSHAQLYLLSQPIDSHRMNNMSMRIQMTIRCLCLWQHHTHQ